MGKIQGVPSKYQTSSEVSEPHGTRTLVFRTVILQEHSLHQFSQDAAKLSSYSGKSFLASEPSFATGPPVWPWDTHYSSGSPRTVQLLLPSFQEEGEPMGGLEHVLRLQCQINKRPWSPRKLSQCQPEQPGIETTLVRQEQRLY